MNLTEKYHSPVQLVNPKLFSHYLWNFLHLFSENVDFTLYTVVWINAFYWVAVSELLEKNSICLWDSKIKELESFFQLRFLSKFRLAMLSVFNILRTIEFMFWLECFVIIRGAVCTVWYNFVLFAPFPASRSLFFVFFLKNIICRISIVG